MFKSLPIDFIIMYHNVYRKVMEFDEAIRKKGDDKRILTRQTDFTQ